MLRENQSFQIKLGGIPPVKICDRKKLESWLLPWNDERSNVYAIKFDADLFFASFKSEFNDVALIEIQFVFAIKWKRRIKLWGPIAANCGLLYKLFIDFCLFQVRFLGLLSYHNRVWIFYLPSEYFMMEEADK